MASHVYCINQGTLALSKATGSPVKTQTSKNPATKITRYYENHVFHSANPYPKDKHKTGTPT